MLSTADLTQTVEGTNSCIFKYRVCCSSPAQLSFSPVSLTAASSLCLPRKDEKLGVGSCGINASQGKFLPLSLF